jgi:hypothetical protein
VTSFSNLLPRFQSTLESWMAFLSSVPYILAQMSTLKFVQFSLHPWKCTANSCLL